MMELQTHGARKYTTSTLLKSSTGLGWFTIAAELRSHGVSETPVIVPQHMELRLAVAGNDNGLVRRIARPEASGCATIFTRRFSLPAPVK